jgi:ABC-type polysaccharide/polyol phosphate transport system ATPase subunit
MNNLALDIVNVTKSYRRYAHRRQFSTLKSALIKRSLTHDLNPSEFITAVDQVSLQVPRGSAFGIIGRNGSGKSTLLKLVVGITKPTSGKVIVDGRVSALIELGAGFHPEISGRENIYINGVMLGLTKKEIAKKFDEIVEFAELEDFIDAPVKTYSSGMYIRLGFSVAVHVNPDILIADEVLAVGDEGFSLKCLDKFGEFRRQGKTILLVTHGLAMVERFCDTALWLDHGKARAEGDPRRVVDSYLIDVGQVEEQQLSSEDRKARNSTQLGQDSDQPSNHLVASEEPPEDMFRAEAGRWGSGVIKITEVVISSQNGPGHVFQSGEKVAIRMSVSASKSMTDFVFGISIFNAEGVCCYGTNTNLEEMRSYTMTGNGEVTFTVESLDLVEGTYKLDAAVHSQEGRPYDYHRLLYTFRVKSRTKDAGIYRPRHQWTFSSNIRFHSS